MFANKEIIEDGRCGERAEIEDILKELSAIRAEMVAAPDLSRPRLDEVHSNYRESARNFLQYLALRRHDLRPLQLRLAALGLSSLGRAESHVLATVDAVMEVLSRLADPSWQKSSEMAEIVDFTKGQQLLSEHTETLFGPAPGRTRSSHHGHHAERGCRKLSSCS